MTIRSARQATGSAGNGYGSTVPLDKCEVHGCQGFWEVCEHVASALDSGQALPMTETLEVVLACDGCVQQFGLLRFEGVKYSDWSEAAGHAYDAIHASSDFWCNQCVATVRLQAARASGQPDPFRAFERTVTFLRRELRDRIDANLRSSFAFRESVVRRGESSLSVRCGALTHPLGILVYYVVDTETQDRIQQCVERCLQGTGLPEYHLEFRAAENWIRTADGGGHTGNEPAIREVWGA